MLPAGNNVGNIFSNWHLSNAKQEGPFQTPTLPGTGENVLLLWRRRRDGKFCLQHTHTGTVSTGTYTGKKHTLPGRGAGMGDLGHGYKEEGRGGGEGHLK